MQSIRYVVNGYKVLDFVKLIKGICVVQYVVSHYCM